MFCKRNMTGSQPFTDFTQHTRAPRQQLSGPSNKPLIDDFPTWFSMRTEVGFWRGFFEEWCMDGMTAWTHVNFWCIGKWVMNRARGVVDICELRCILTLDAMNDMNRTSRDDLKHGKDLEFCPKLGQLWILLERAFGSKSSYSYSFMVSWREYSKVLDGVKTYQ